MLLAIGYIIVLASTLGGFMIAGGHPAVLMHVSEFVVIGGISIGLLVVASPKDVLMRVFYDVIDCFKNSGVTKEEIIDLLQLLYELFLVGRRNGLIALDEHVTEPKNSTIFKKYPSFLSDQRRIDFLCNGLRPIIDGKIKPDQLQAVLNDEIESMEDEAHRPLSVLALIGDSLPGVGIIAAVLGIINTMSSISDGPEAVGHKVAAALTGTFLGILGAYGFVNPITKRIDFKYNSTFLYYNTIAKSVSGFAKGMAPVMAIEIARRSLNESLQPGADELEKMLKKLNPAN